MRAALLSTSAASAAEPPTVAENGDPQQARRPLYPRFSGGSTIRRRIVLLSATLLLVLAASNLYLARKLADNAAATVESSRLLGTIELADNAQAAFGEMRYWMTDLAVSLLILSETKAKAAQARTERYLDQLAAQRPERAAAIRSEVNQYRDLAMKAVDAYTDDRRVIGNSLLAQARQHSIVADEMLAAIVAELNAESAAARDRVVAQTAAATGVSQGVVVATLVAGALFTFLVLRSIARPLRRLVVAMNGLNAGDTGVDIPTGGPDEIGAMAHTLVAFRGTMHELRQTLDEQRRREQELRRAHDELKAAQANLIHAEKMASLGQLTAGIAHEIKNPLNFVNNFATLSIELLDELKETAAPGLAALDETSRADADETLELLTGNLAKIAEHGRRADGIVRSMLLHSRGDSGEVQSVDLNALIEEALNLAYHGARAQDQNFNIALARDLDSTIRPLGLVPQDMTRVFLNLFANGFYAANKRARGGEADFKPVLKVSTREVGDGVEIRVRDNGIGMSSETADKLFQPFFTTKPTGEGTGLGLSISYDIVTQQHGGTIAVDSEEGQFTEFTIRLPRRGAPLPQRTGA
ncbi:MAG: HAMP domain-containing protein [Xanthobacteraceae bacterium]|nr:HAMP domain-containing protein [Xanthobacteraceae bacterium]